MKQQIKLGVVCLARKTFDYLAATEIYKELLTKLSTLDNVELFAYPELVIEPEEAEIAGDYLYSKDVDCMAIISGTFHLGHLALLLKKKVDKPVLFWGLDELPYNGGKIRLNSVCGVNLNASNFVKSGFSDFSYTIGASIDNDWLDAVRIIVGLRKTNLGIIGYRAQGFFNLDVDDLAVYRKFGVLINHYEIEEIQGMEVSCDEVAIYTAKITKTFDTTKLNDIKINTLATLTAKFKKFMDTKGLNTIAIRCWPEFANKYGMSPCAAMSILQSEGYIMACEGDIDCALTMIAHSSCGAETPFMADLSQVNIEQDFALMWHCGVAPCNLADGICNCSLETYFAGGRGVTADFVMKSGNINMTRLDSINGKYRLLNVKGEAIHMNKELSGTYAKVRFEMPMKDVLDKVVYTGVAHHVSMVYGDYSKAFEMLARLLQIEIL